MTILGNENRDWLEILNLKTDDRVFKDALTKSLGLERLAIQEGSKGTARPQRISRVRKEEAR